MRSRSPHPERLSAATVGVGVAAVLGIAWLGAVLGPADLGAGEVARAILDRLPWVSLDSGLSARETDILFLVRLPRVVLGLLVGAALALCGAAYQGVFRNPLADPYLLGVAAGAGLGATLAVVGGGGSTGLVPVAAFLGGLGAVVLTYFLGRMAGSASSTTLILAGVAVASFLTAVQTFVQQRNDETLRQVYSWILGRLSTNGWSEVSGVLPYILVTSVVILANRRVLDVLAVGDAEAASLGVDVARVRIIVVLAATLGTAAAVAVSGLIGFVGIIVPHAVRLMFGFGNRIVLPLAALGGAVFLTAADIVARTALSPAELPIGVVTAFTGAPFFALVLRNARVES